MPADSPVYNVAYGLDNSYAGTPESLLCEYPGGLFTSPDPGPMHRSCAVYSTLVCPFMKYETSRHRIPEYKGGTRGEAGIFGFRQYGVAFFTEPVNRGLGATTLRAWGYLDPVERAPFASWKETLPLYGGALADDAKVIDTSTRWDWSDSPAHERHLKEIARHDEAQLRLLRMRAMRCVNGYWYRLAML